MTKTRSDIDAEEIRKLLRSIQGEGSPRTKECREYRRSVMDRLSCIVEGFGYPEEVMPNHCPDGTCSSCPEPTYCESLRPARQIPSPLEVGQALLAVGESLPSYFGDPRHIRRRDNTPCPFCQLVGDHYCPEKP